MFANLIHLKLKCVVLVFLFLPLNGYKVLKENKGTLSGQARSLQTGPASVIDAVSSRLKSVFRKQNQKQHKRRRQGSRKVSPPLRLLKDPIFMEDESFYLPDSGQKRWGSEHRFKVPKQKMPKIYITKLPDGKIREEPKIFYSKQLKENETYFTTLQSVRKETMGANSPLITFEEITLSTDDKISSEDKLEPAMKSDHLYQENANDMIYDHHKVHWPINSDLGFNGKNHVNDNSTMHPLLEFVSSTAMIIGDPPNGYTDDKETEEEETVQPNPITLDSAENIEMIAPNIILSSLQDEDWKFPITISASLTIGILLLFEVFICMKSRRNTPSHRNLFMGQMLMMGLLSCAVVSLLYTFKPTPAICALIRFGSGMSYTLVYSTLLVKMIFLISLNSEIYLPATYQILLLFFAILIQLVIGIQWLVAVPPDVAQGSCKTSFQQQLHGNIYNMFLITVLTILSLKYRKIKPVYREALYISITLVLSIIIWCVWIIAGFIVPSKYNDLCSSAGLLASTIAIFCTMFLPKGRQLSAAGKEGVYSEDRAEVYNKHGKRRHFSNISLFSVNNGRIQFCLPAPNIVLKTKDVENEAQNAVVKSYLSNPFGSQRNNKIPSSVSSGVDGDIYSLEEELTEGQLSIQSRSETWNNFSRPKLAEDTGTSDDKHTLNSLTTSCDRFPFSSRPPQFDPNPREEISNTGSQTNVSTHLYGVYSQHKLASSQSLSNPNVLFCSPDDMTRSIIY